MRTAIPVTSNSPPWWRLGVTGLLLSLLTSGPLLAQGSTGNITGSVYTETGAPIPKPQVSLLGTQRMTLTNARGNFLLPHVPAGSAASDAVALGYRTGTDGVTVGAASA